MGGGQEGSAAISSMYFMVGRDAAWRRCNSGALKRTVAAEKITEVQGGQRLHADSTAGARTAEPWVYPGTK